MEYWAHHSNTPGGVFDAGLCGGGCVQSSDAALGADEQRGQGDCVRYGGDGLELAAAAGERASVQRGRPLSFSVLYGGLQHGAQSGASGCAVLPGRGAAVAEARYLERVVE